MITHIFMEDLIQHKGVSVAAVAAAAVVNVQR